VRPIELRRTLAVIATKTKTLPVRVRPERVVSYCDAAEGGSLGSVAGTTLMIRVGVSPGVSVKNSDIGSSITGAHLNI
jgi:hypothetical protein